MKEVILINEVINRVNEYMCRVSKYGVIVCFIALLSAII